MKRKYKLGVIGAGFMAHAIVCGINSSKAAKKLSILVSDQDSAALNKFSNLKVHTTTANADIFERCEFVLLAIKPQTFIELSSQFSNFKASKIISIMAGITKQKIKSVFKDAQVARCMPNTPISLGVGMSAIDSFDFNAKDQSFINMLFASSGQTLAIDENKMDAVTAISGSGPAYVYMFIDSLVQAGIGLGLTKSQALMLSTATVFGGAQMVFENQDKEIKDLINAVCSKGGTTIEAVNVIEQSNFNSIINQAVLAAAKRAKELSSL